MARRRKKTQTPKHAYKMRQCESCGRDHKVFPVRTKNRGVSYRGRCPWCGVFDYARAGTRGHLELPYDEKNDD